MQKQEGNQASVKPKPNVVLKEDVPHIKSDAGIGIMKHSDGRVEKRKFNM
jgi:hypothetical protein